MKFTGANELREMFLQFFEEKEHLRMESFPLVPKNDNSLLLINAGMAPLKPYFTGIQVPPSNRVTTCQKCIRTGDIENVGKTSRHGTFFEMLGDFSFGDYFKNEIIPWSWEFVTKVLNIPKEKMYVTIYLEDDEAYDIWTTKTDIDKNRIFRLGKDDNFWEVGTVGPCGPCTEIHFDRGNKVVTTAEEFVEESDKDNIIEFWNLVFIQFNKDENGNYNKLEKQSIDTGMGLERIATIMQGVDNIFEIDTVKNIINKISDISKVSYGSDSNKDISLRIIADHTKAVTMLISDGVQPSNEGRGYVLRRLLRRAARHGRLLGIKGLFLKEIVESVIDNYGKNYPQLIESKDYLIKIITLEEERFNETIDTGMSILNGYIDELKNSNLTVLSGEKAFKLYDTYGFPIELTEEILEDVNFTVDTKSFSEEMEEQRTRARSARGETSYMGSDETPINKIKADMETSFVGYDNIKVEDNIVLMATDVEFVEQLNTNQKGYIVTSKTPFYAEMGGQIGDTGFIIGDNGKAKVFNTKKNIGGKTIHYVEVLEGTLKSNDLVILQVDKTRRDIVCKNHTATHMLQQALKEVLGSHIQQAGSYVDEERLRFDFTHFQAISCDELQKIESLVNEKIMEVGNVFTELMTVDEAKECGATALFDEKYGDKVRVVNAGKFSIELCGGTHVSNVGEIGLFKIISESGVAAGIRRIEAVTGLNAIKFMDEKYKMLKEACASLKCSEKDVIKKISSQLTEIKCKEKEISDLKSKLTSGSQDEILKTSREINGVNVIVYSIDGVDANSLRDLCDKLRNKLSSGVIVLLSNLGDKVSLVSMCSKDVIDKGIHCGKIIKEVASCVGGGGGGRPDMAQAGGKNPSNINKAVDIAYETINKLLD